MAGHQALQATQASVAALHHTSALRHEAMEAVGQVQSGMDTLYHNQRETLNVARSSEARNSEAVHRIEELTLAQAEDQKQFQQRMTQMEDALKK